MARPHFLEVPSGKIRDERRAVQVLNSVRSGKTNNVGDFTVPGTTVSPHTVYDTRVSEWSFIGITAKNDKAATIHSSNLEVACSDGSFQISYTGVPSTDALFRYVVIG